MQIDVRLPLRFSDGKQVMDATACWKYPGVTIWPVADNVESRRNGLEGQVSSL